MSENPQILYQDSYVFFLPRFFFFTMLNKGKLKHHMSSLGAIPIPYHV